VGVGVGDFGLEFVSVFHLCHYYMDLNKAEVLSAHTPLYSCKVTPSNFSAVANPSKTQLYEEVGSCKENEVKNRLSAKNETWPWKECGCVGTCWHERSAANMLAPLPHSTDQQEPEKNFRRKAPVNEIEANYLPVATEGTTGSDGKQYIYSFC